jgi:ABC-type branched-subunit amino acid transport system ATPase component
MLQLESVTAFYGRTQALFGVDLEVARGQTIALVGTNGAGKTTTLRALLGQDVLDLFPALRDRLEEKVSLLSGGQQQMVALGRALLRDPAYLLLDEPALGLAPVVIDEIYGYIAELRSRGMGVLLVEQSVARAAAVADHLCLLRTGRVDRVVPAPDQAAIDALIAEAFDVHARIGGEVH